MEVSADYAGGTRFEVAARGHRVTCDQPPDNGGADSGMTPPEFLLASLATCAGFYAAQYLNTRKLPTAGLKVTVSAQKALQPARLASFRIEVHLDGLDPRHEAGLLRAVKACLIHHTLEHPPAIEIAVLAPASVT
jgi:putative redox protein